MLNTLEIINLDLHQAKIAASIFDLLEKKHKRLDEFDVLIGSATLAYKDKLLTRNTKHFSRIPMLKVERW